MIQDDLGYKTTPTKVAQQTIMHAIALARANWEKWNAYGLDTKRLTRRERQRINAQLKKLSNRIAKNVCGRAYSYVDGVDWPNLDESELEITVLPNGDRYFSEVKHVPSGLKIYAGLYDRPEYARDAGISEVTRAYHKKFWEDYEVQLPE